MADPSQIEQVIVNLAVNARDAMPDGGMLTIETKDVDLGAPPHPSYLATPGRYVSLVVSDTGCGMDEGTLSQVFEPFFTTKPEGRGTGLGLATTYGVVRQSGGDVRVYSEPGKGATFKIYLPRIEETATDADGRADETAAPRGGETVLCVEDEEAVRKLVAMDLRDYGYTVLEASDASEALRMSGAHDGPIHLLVSDVVLPGPSGREVHEALAADRPGLRVLYMSGHAEGHIVHHGLQDPGVALISKPFEGEDLARRVREILDGPAPRGYGAPKQP
jgi:CheY-like chemotaxis protein